MVDQTKMRAVVWQGKPFSVIVTDVPKPDIVQLNDVIVQITTAAICGTDLHIYHGPLAESSKPFGLGHEAVGVIVKAGAGVSHFKVGDRVVIPDFPDTGFLQQEVSSYALYGVGSALDGIILGGCQAEYVRVPSADESLLKISADPDKDLDYVLLSDIWPTAWQCVTWSGFQAGDSVAVFGAGPVGLLCAYSALLRGASRVFAVDHVPVRLEKAESIGAIPIDLRKGSPAAQILAILPDGVERSCDCCGEEALNDRIEPQQNYIINEAVAATKYEGGIGIVGVYAALPPSPTAPLAGSVAPTVDFPISAFWGKNLTVKAGAVDPKPLWNMLNDLITAGRARPSFVFSSRVGIESAARYYDRFDKKLETKVAIRFVEDEILDGGDNSTASSL